MAPSVTRCAAFPIKTMRAALALCCVLLAGCASGTHGTVTQAYDRMYKADIKYKAPKAPKPAALAVHHGRRK